MLYGKTMKEICAKLGVDRKELPNRLYSTLLGAIKDRVSSVTDKAVSGNIARMDDVSPVEQSVSVKVKSKNLYFNHISKTVSINSGALTCKTVAKESGFILNGTTATETSAQISSGIPLKAGTYTVSMHGTNIVDGNKDRLYLVNVSGGVLVNYIMAGAPKTFTLDKDTIVAADLVFGKGTVYDNAVCSIQIEEGDTATEYTPYVDVSTVKVTRCGKNLLNLENASGDVQDLYRGWLVNPTGQNVVVSLTDNDTSIDLSDVYFGATTNGIDATEGYEWLVEKGEVRRNSYTGTFKYFSVFPPKDETVKKVRQRFNIQVELGTTATEYEPYKGETYNPNADGTVDGVASVSPTMTIFADKEGVTLDVEYTRDFESVKGSVK